MCDMCAVCTQLQQTHIYNMLCVVRVLRSVLALCECLCVVCACMSTCVCDTSVCVTQCVVCCEFLCDINMCVKCMLSVLCDYTDTMAT